jgi:hypothetical protein
MSELELERLREAFLEPASTPEAALECAPADRIFDAAIARLAPEEARKLLAHNLHCGACTAAWRLARALADEVGLDQLE